MAESGVTSGEVSTITNGTSSDSLAKITIEIPPTSVADDETFVTTIVGTVNAAYAQDEAGIFKPGYLRTKTTPQSPSGRTPLGCISIRKLSDTRGELGLFAVSLDQRGRGFGRDLLVFAENWCRDNLGGPGVAISQVDLLVPTHFEHPFKVRLNAWYSKLGYQLVGRQDFAVEYPSLAPQLAGPTEYRLYEKKL
ncbi:uncharacterized protein F4822DRAFT_408874, partial [Hypoxylon trugodes]|uniref:uncharacterized protein n=1 Tax=Hypoxylon trugodes TaxID=326681 RepID=UPI0021A2106B